MYLKNISEEPVYVTLKSPSRRTIRVKPDNFVKIAKLQDLTDEIRLMLAEGKLYLYEEEDTSFVKNPFGKRVVGFITVAEGDSFWDLDGQVRRFREEGVYEIIVASSFDNNELRLKAYKLGIEYSFVQPIPDRPWPFNYTELFSDRNYDWFFPLKPGQSWVQGAGAEISIVTRVSSGIGYVRAYTQDPNSDLSYDFVGVRNLAESEPVNWAEFENSERVSFKSNNALPSGVKKILVAPSEELRQKTNWVPKSVALIMPTRERSIACLKTMSDWLSKVSAPKRVVAYLALDQDDPELNLYNSIPKKLEKYGVTVHISVNPNNGMCEAVHRSLSLVNEDVIVIASDDQYPPKGWDVKIRKKLVGGKGKALMLWDGLSKLGDGSADIPVATRNLKSEWGYILWPKYFKLWSDNDFYERAVLEGRCIWALDLEFKHDSVYAGKREKDDTFKRFSTPEHLEAGREMLNYRFLRNFRFPPPNLEAETEKDESEDVQL